MRLTRHVLGDDPALQATFYGPVVLAAQLPKGELSFALLHKKRRVKGEGRTNRCARDCGKRQAAPRLVAARGRGYGYLPRYWNTRGASNISAAERELGAFCGVPASDLRN